jgi:hypothetical protein
VFFSFSAVRGFFFSLFFLPLLCSAFYRARELALNQSLLQSCIYRTVNQSTSGIVGKRCGPWSDQIAAVFPVE